MNKENVETLHTQSELDALEADRLLNHPRFKQAFSNIRERIVARLESTPIGDEDQRLELVISLQLLKSVRQDIENDIKTLVLDDSEAMLP